MMTMSAMRRFSIIPAVFTWLVLVSVSGAQDWPQWRYDAGRSAASPHDLSSELHLQWVRELPSLVPAWEDTINRDRMTFDRVYEPIVTGSMLIFGSSRNDRVTALDTGTGNEKWRFYADGPVRLPPAAHRGKVYFVSDDGYLYCLNTLDGRLIWKVRAGPSERKILGNSRMISTWPARGGPVVKDGIVYFAGSIWPFMGVFIYALNAETGSTVWVNDSTGSMFMSQPHGGADAFGGIAPQGALVICGDKLLVPGGRTVPGCFDLKTGKLLYYNLSGSPAFGEGEYVNNKREGGSHVSAIGKYYFNHRGMNTVLYDLETGGSYRMWGKTTYPVLTRRRFYLSGQPVEAHDLGSLRIESYEAREWDPETEKRVLVTKQRWRTQDTRAWQIDGSVSLIKAGTRLYAGGTNKVSAINLGAARNAVEWSAAIDGLPARMIAGNGSLFVVTRKGSMYAFGNEPRRRPTGYANEVRERKVDAATVSRAKAILSRAGVRQGYVLVFGVGSGDLVAALVRNSECRVIGVDPDPARVGNLRHRFDEEGLYGTRIALHVGDPVTYRAPEYVARLILSEDLGSAGFEKKEAFFRAVFGSIRPYGGKAFFPLKEPADRTLFRKYVSDMKLASARVEDWNGYAILVRDGPLPDSSDWTHLYGDSANTAKSNDKLVKLPMGVLWFGGSTHEDVLPRHGHGPSEQVVGGRLFIEGADCLSARDVYTGQVLWKRTFEDLDTFGVYYDKTFNPLPFCTSYNQVHIPGANARGVNFVAIDKEVYVITSGCCQVLDAENGTTVRRLRIPAENGEKPVDWGYIAIHGNIVVAGASFVKFSEKHGSEPSEIADPQSRWQNFDATSSRRLVVMDRHTGKVLWSRSSSYGFRHNAIAVGGGKVFCIDSLPQPIVERLKQRGRTVSHRPELMALDLRTGKEIWHRTTGVFGTWLSYSHEHDVLLQGGRHSADMIAGEASNQMSALRGRNGKTLWQRSGEYSGPCILHGRTIYLNATSARAGRAIALLNGSTRKRREPLTGVLVPWQYTRAYGCNSAVGAEHALFFRSGAAGYVDLVADAGTGNFGGFKSGCTANLIAANGVLNAPDYTRTCTCSYQNQTSLALVHMPKVETWTCSEAVESDPAPIIQMGINFGAPGDRRDEHGTLWLEYPFVGGPSPHVPIEVEGSQYDRFCHHSSRVESGKPPWVVASGLEGARSITIPMVLSGRQSSVGAARGRKGWGRVSMPPHQCDVTLWFMEPGNVGAGGRIFSVKIQGEEVLKDLDIFKTAGGRLKGITKRVADVTVGGSLLVEFEARRGRSIICGIEIKAQD